VVDMLFQNIVKSKKIGGLRLGGAGVGTASPNGGCTAGAPASDYLGAAGGDALTISKDQLHSWMQNCR
jgi:hypothetical protein